MLRPVRQAQFVQIIHRHLVPLLAGNALVKEREFHILDRRLERNQVEGLEDEADHPVAVIGGLPFAQVPDQTSVEPVFAGIVIIQDTQE
jgi:hypothetical protein